MTNLTTITYTAGKPDPATAGVVSTVDALLALDFALGGGKKISDLYTALTTAILSFASRAYAAVVFLTRTNDTNAYLANDVIGSATGSTAALTFANVAVGAGEVEIVGAGLEIDAASLISGESNYRLYLYNVTPPSALGDNAAWDLNNTGGKDDRTPYLGFIDLGIPADLGSTLYCEVNGIGKRVTLASANLYGYLVTTGAYTPTASRVYKVTLHTSVP